ncbi:MAG: CHASE2 domain-containing protein, partial [Candidatus Abyssubacteria bacterium]|nr:CHASE2 domain-containing protein [Candidatus Abyssubacteria bacterium]
MAEISEDTRHKLTEIAMALLIGLAFFLFSLTSPYERLELLSLDARFNLRPPIQTNPDIATIDIDDRALEDEGRWQDWTRDKHARIIDIVRRGGGALIGFDMYFSEESQKTLRPIDVARANSLEEVYSAFRDFDAELATAAKRAGNVYWAATFLFEEEKEKPGGKQAAYGSASSAWKNFNYSVEAGHVLAAQPASAGSTLRALAPRAFPIAQLIEAGRGVGFAQIRREADGVVRKYPTMIICRNAQGDGGGPSYMVPSIGLAMACDYLQVPLRNLKLRPGRYLEIPDAYMPDGSKKDLRIPINEKGEMIINWAGDYPDAFNHFPYSSLTTLEQQETLRKIKAFLATQDPEIFQRPGDLLAGVGDAFPDVSDSATYATYIYGAHWYERLIETENAGELDPSVFTQLFGLAPEDGPELYETQLEVFENVRLNHGMLELLSESPGVSPREAAEKLGVEEEAAEHSHTIVSRLLGKGGPSGPDRPLYFLPPVIVGDKQLSFEDLKGGVFFYGLTAPGTHDLNPMPFSPRYPMVGAIANVFNTIVTGQFITPMPPSWRLPLFVVVGLFAGFILSSRAAIRGSLFTNLFLVSYLLLAYWLFANRGMWIEVVGSTGIVLFSNAAIVWYKFNTAEKKRKFIRNAFEHYMNPAVVEQIAKNPDMLELGGKEMVLTAFFSDVEGFTAISEKLSPHELV